MSREEVNLAVLQNDISYIRKEVGEIKQLVQDQYVTLSMFDPVKRIVYGLVALILVAIVGAILRLIIIT